jgi:C1A family cysteine protease
MINRFCLFVVVAACLAWCSLPGIVSAGDQLPELAPVNPEFTGFMAVSDPAQLRLFTAVGEEEHPLGFVPGPVDYSYLTGQQIAAETSASFQLQRLFAPLQYDLRTQGKLTPVRDQGTCGDCWAFAAMGSAESVLTPGESRDFSENNLKNRHGFDWGHCDGGNGDMSTAYLARLDGPVNETDDPYNAVSNVSPAGLPLQKILTKAVIIPPRASFTDNDAIKQAIIDYGAVQSSYYASSSTSYYRAATASYYYNGASTSNHAINLVGWDDNYDRNNFATLPPDNGAFIVRNSWGTGWGQSGYFYLSYYDSKIGYNNYQFRGLEPATSYATVYQYDPLGKTSGLGYGNPTAWFANIFTASGTESIAAVAFHAASAGSTYDWYVYTGVTTGPRTGTLAASGSGLTLAEPGYHVVPVTPVPVTPGQKFSVVIRLTTPGYNYPVPMEYPYPGYASLATAVAGQSYFSSNGAGWSDLTGTYANTNVALKALSRYAVTAGTSGGNGSLSSVTPFYTGSGGTATFDLAPNSGFKPNSTVTGTCAAGSFFNNTYTTGLITGNCDVGFSFVPSTTYNLTLAVSGDGGGSISVAPSPPGAVCPGNCNQAFNAGNVVTLTPVPGSGAAFSSWSGACSGSGSCQVTMDGAKSVTATFAWLPNVKNSTTGNLHGLISQLYDLLSDGETLLARGIDFTENLVFSRPLSFTLRGGYDSGFQTASTYSTVHGSLTINDGCATLENIVIAQ